MAFIEHEKLGRLKVYKITEKFQNYFGITDLNSMKNKLLATTNNENENKMTKRIHNDSSPQKSLI
jgi:chromosome segregation and condensation protein ScpB